MDAIYNRTYQHVAGDRASRLILSTKPSIHEQANSFFTQKFFFDQLAFKTFDKVVSPLSVNGGTVFFLIK